MIAIGIAVLNIYERALKARTGERRHQAADVPVHHDVAVRHHLLADLPHHWRHPHVGPRADGIVRPARVYDRDG